MSKQKKLKPELASGFRDRKGNELILKDRLIEIIKRNFQLFGFEPLETPGFELSENIGKFLPDEDRPMAGVFGFKDEKDWISLRYDLTAPLARYVSENFDNLSKPFKRYQVGSVWRNEKPGPGRYREFTQIDADIVGTKSVLADADMCVLLVDTLNKCGLDKNEYLIKVSNRKLIQGLLEELKVTSDLKKLTAIRAADKLDRVGISGVRALLGKGRKDKSGDFTKGAGLTENQKTILSKKVEEIKPAEWDIDVPTLKVKGKEWLKSQVSRAFLPKYFPNYEKYLWIDCDAWVNDWNSVELYFRACSSGKLGITQTLGPGYKIMSKVKWLFGKLAIIKSQNFKHAISSKIDLNKARKLAFAPHINIGVFSLEHDSPGWNSWQKNLQQTLKSGKIFGSEGLAINMSVYIDNIDTEFLPLNCNWIASNLLPKYDENLQTFVEPYLPNYKIGIMHLAAGIWDGDKDMRLNKDVKINVKTLQNNIQSKSLRFRN